MEVSINGQLVCIGTVVSDKGMLYANVSWSADELYLLVNSREEGTPPDEDDHTFPVPDIRLGDAISIRCLPCAEPATPDRSNNNNNADPPRFPKPEEEEAEAGTGAVLRALQVSLNDRAVCTTAVRSFAGVVDVYVHWSDDGAELCVLAGESWSREHGEECRRYPVPRIRGGDVVTIRVVGAATASATRIPDNSNPKAR